MSFFEIKQAIENAGEKEEDGDKLLIINLLTNFQPSISKRPAVFVPTQI
jgi:hypothetical protein